MSPRCRRYSVRSSPVTSSFLSLVVRPGAPCLPFAPSSVLASSSIFLFRPASSCFGHCSPNSLLLGFYLRNIELATLTCRAPELCGWVLSSSCPRLGRTPELCQLCGWALCPGLVLLLSSVAGLCVQALSSSCPLWLGSVSRPCPPLVPQTVYCWGSIYQAKIRRWPHSLSALLKSVTGLCGWALCPGLVLLLSSVAGLCVQALSSSCPLWRLCVQAFSSSCPPRGRAPDQWLGCGWALCPGLVLLLSSVAGLCVQALSSSCPLWRLCVQAFSSSCPPRGRAPDQWLGCGWALSSSCPCLGRAPELCGWSLWPGLLERSVAEQIAMSTPTKIH